MWWRRLIAIGLIVAYIAGQGQWAWRAVSRGAHGRDYATYHYALKAAVDGQDPYNTRDLSRRAKDEGERRAVHPYFYPPPFLWGVLWAAPMGLHDAYKVWFFINQALLVGTLWVLRRWTGVGWLSLGAIAVTLSPIGDSVKMGQANQLVLLLMCVGLWRTSGLWLSAAAMAKMSPALLLAWWGTRHQWRPVLFAVLGAVGLSVLTLPLVGFDQQINFYQNILPGFSDGDYHGLKIPVTLPGNHSIPDVYNQIWPGPTKHRLSGTGQRLSALTSLALLVGLCVVGRTRRDAIGDACLAGAFTVLLVITPAYTYEHHFAFLLLPAVAVVAAVQGQRLPRWGVPLAVASYFFVAWPLNSLRWA
ncbi:MAG: glycosyltransferase family 87 protein, partial [Myxococcota bacterium]